jgi:large subunit ribosomal protein L21
MYAVVELAGRQYRVSPGDELFVEKLAVEAGSELKLPVLLLSDDSGTVTVGKPLVEGKQITAQVVGDQKGEKLVIFKYHPKKRYRKKTGHRQNYTKIKIVG